MSIFTSNSYQYFDTDSNNISATGESLMNAVAESSAEIYKLIGALYVSDVLAEQAMFEGNMYVTTEGALGDFFKRVKDGFKRILAKIKAWFAKVFTTIKNAFMSTATFAKTYGSEIVKKVAKIETKDFFDGYLYDFSKLEKAYTEIPDEIAVYAAGMKESNVTKIDVDEQMKKVYVGISKSSKCESLSDCVEKVGEDIRGDKDKKSRDINSAFISKLVDFCKNYNYTVSTIASLQSKSEKLINACIADVNNMERDEKITGELASSKVSYMNKCIAALNSFNALFVSITKEIYGTGNTVLRRIYKAKPKDTNKGTKESATLFESAFDLL